MQITATPEEILADQTAGKARKLGNGQDKAREAKAIKKVAQEFEAIFIGMMMKSMRETVGKNELMSGGHGEDVFRSLLDQEYANAAAASGGTGLASMIEKELTRRSTPAAVQPTKRENMPQHNPDEAR
jgi:flagellar protein FlgJ